MESPLELGVQKLAIITPGSGSSAHAGNVVTISYTGKLPDGSVFSVFDESSKAGSGNVTFTLGDANITPGGCGSGWVGEGSTFIVVAGPTSSITTPPPRPCPPLQAST